MLVTSKALDTVLMTSSASVDALWSEEDRCLVGVVGVGEIIGFIGGIGGGGGCRGAGLETKLFEQIFFSGGIRLGVLEVFS